MRHYSVMVMNPDNNMVRMHNVNNFNIMSLLLEMIDIQEEKYPDEKYRIISIEELFT